MESNAASLGGFCGRRHTEHGSDGNDADDCLSHINLFSLIVGRRMLRVGPSIQRDPKPFPSASMIIVSR